MESMIDRPSDMIVRVSAPARLHLGFLDLDGGLGRRFGSLGIGIEAPRTVLRAQASGKINTQGRDADRAASAVRRLCQAVGVEGGMDLVVEAALPAHAGLGSGTQMALAAGAALSRLYGLDLSARRMAELLGRGRRSATGIEIFERGGVVLDGGRGAGTQAPPLLARLPFPRGWRILLIGDTAGQGLSGDPEMQAMNALAPYSDRLADRLCRLVLMQALPALAEENSQAFGVAIGEMQRRIGEHFAPAQGGGRYTSPAVAALMERVEGMGVEGVGQSSWGPTGFAIIGEEQRAQAIWIAMREAARERPGLWVDLVRGDNRGVEVVAEASLAGAETVTQHGD